MALLSSTESTAFIYMIVSKWKYHLFTTSWNGRFLIVNASGQTTVKRREVLKRDLGFWCICDACVSQTIPSLYMEDVRSKHVFVRNTLSMERNQNKHKLSQALGMNPLFMVRVTTDHLISCLLEMKSNQERQISEEMRQMFGEIKRFT